ncbi:MAG: hypothetical protein ABI384_03225 [Allobranchiibius sp.]
MTQFQDFPSGAVGHGRDPQPAQLATRFRDHPLPRGIGMSCRAFNCSRSPVSSSARVGDIDRCESVDAAGPLSPVAPDPTPCDNEHGVAMDEVDQIIDPTVRITDRPVAQLGLHSQYPGLRFCKRRPR